MNLSGAFGGAVKTWNPEREKFHEGFIPDGVHFDDAVPY
jgi:hypothetical protein